MNLSTSSIKWKIAKPRNKLNEAYLFGKKGFIKLNKLPQQDLNNNSSKPASACYAEY